MNDISAHKKRWITGVVSVPFITLAILEGRVLFSLFVGIAGTIALWEYFKIVYSQKKSLFNSITILGFISCILIITANHAGSFNIAGFFIALNLMAAALIAVINFKNGSDILESLIKQFQGIIYIPFMLGFIILIRNSNFGASWVFFLLIMVFSADTGAFYAGRHYGKNKLCPSVSPGKTIEGFVGGIAGTIIMGSIFKLIFLSHLLWFPSFLLFICIGTVAPVGDMFESMLKRAANIKDSGKILPGHGGVLDRIDALLFACPVAYFFKELVF